MPVFILGGDSIDFEDTTAKTNDVKIGKTFIDSNGDLVLGLLDQSDATANEEQILSGYTAYNNFEKIVGSMINRPARTNITNVKMNDTHALNFYISFPKGAYINSEDNIENNPELIIPSSSIGMAIHQNRNGRALSNLDLLDINGVVMGTYNESHWIYRTERTDIINDYIMRFCLIPCWMIDSKTEWMS